MLIRYSSRFYLQNEFEKIYNYFNTDTRQAMKSSLHIPFRNTNETDFSLRVVQFSCQNQAEFVRISKFPKDSNVTDTMVCILGHAWEQQW